MQDLLNSALQAIENANNSNELKEIEIKYLGKKGLITEQLKTLKDLSEEDKRTTGKAIQEIKQKFLSAYQKKASQLEIEEINSKLTAEFFDITLPRLNKINHSKKGTIHPLNQLQQQVEEIFSDMGFEIADGPEVESEYYNFEALNIPSHHPARDMQDTFFIENKADPKHGELILRTHTSPVQIRTMELKGAPLRIIVPGRVFRYEATDATHDSTFNQVEGLLIDKNIGLADLKGIMEEFLSRLFEKDITVRFRPGYFPFVEPGLELDILWQKGKNGQSDKWLEFMGAGMVHPNVLKAGGIDPENNQGWAFGFGITRLAMIKYQIADIRQIHNSDLRFLKQF
ncbi:phenylalanine--tRNA ligase subunit alpha [Candidatus Peregrinibacteria bacterium]|nr:phenylalanine--tRNA ligase subunit alpha [Candidatus Peregrinibacteria bacterium]